MMPNPRIGVCSWSLRPRDPRQLVGALQGLGIENVQLALVPVVAEPAVWGQATEILAAAGVRVVSGMLAMKGEDYSTLDSIRLTGGVRCDAGWPENAKLAEAVAEAAGRAGLRLVTLHAGFLDDPSLDDAARLTMLDRLRAVVDLFAARGVNVAFETGQETADTLLDVLDRLDRPTAGVNFDPANMILYGMGDPVQALRRLGPRVVQVHVKDALGSGRPGSWGREVPAGHGEVDWDALFEVALRIDPPVNFIIEREGSTGVPADIADARALIERRLAPGRCRS